MMNKMNYSTKVFLKAAIPLALGILVVGGSGFALLGCGPVGVFFGLCLIGLAVCASAVLCVLWGINQAE